MKEAALLTEEELVFLYLKSAGFINWMGAITDYMYDQAVKHNKKWDGLKLVEGRSNRVLVSEDEIIKKLKKAGFEYEEFQKTKLAGIKELEQLVGGARKFMAMFGHLVRKPVGKPVLVSEDDDRPELNSKEKYFNYFD